MQLISRGAGQVEIWVAREEAEALLKQLDQLQSGLRSYMDFQADVDPKVIRKRRKYIRQEFRISVIDEDGDLRLTVEEDMAVLHLDKNAIDGFEVNLKDLLAGRRISPEIAEIDVPGAKYSAYLILDLLE